MPTPSVTSYLFHHRLINLIISSIWHYSSWIHTESHKHIASPSCRWPSGVAFLPHEILTIFLGPLPLENPFKITFNLWMGTSNNPLFFVPMRNTENSVSTNSPWNLDMCYRLRGFKWEAVMRCAFREWSPRTLWLTNRPTDTVNHFRTHFMCLPDERALFFLLLFLTWALWWNSIVP